MQPTSQIKCVIVAVQTVAV